MFESTDKVQLLEKRTRKTTLGTYSVSFPGQPRKSPEIGACQQLLGRGRLPLSMEVPLSPGCFCPQLIATVNLCSLDNFFLISITLGIYQHRSQLSTAHHPSSSPFLASTSPPPLSLALRPWPVASGLPPHPPTQNAQRDTRQRKFSGLIVGLPLLARVSCFGGGGRGEGPTLGRGLKSPDLPQVTLFAKREGGSDGVNSSGRNY